MSGTPIFRHPKLGTASRAFLSLVITVFTLDDGSVRDTDEPPNKIVSQCPLPLNCTTCDERVDYFASALVIGKRGDSC